MIIDAQKEKKWQQSFKDFERAYLFLKEATKLESYDAEQAVGLIKIFKFALEFSWKTLRDLLNLTGTIVSEAKETIHSANKSGILTDEAIWLDMLEKQDKLFDPNNKLIAQQSSVTICKDYFPAIERAYETLKKID